MPSVLLLNGGSLVDATGRHTLNTHEGTVTSSGGLLSFDGASSLRIDDNLADFSFPGSFTIEGQLNVSTSYTGTGVFISNYDGAAATWEMWVRGSDNGYKGGFYSEGRLYVEPSAFVVVTGSTVDFAFVYDDVGGAYHIYLNGTRIETGSVSIDNTIAAPGSFYIGREQPGAGENYFEGLLRLHVVKGEALYTGASYTPPSWPIGAGDSFDADQTAAPTTQTSTLASRGAVTATQTAAATTQTATAAAPAKVQGDQAAATSVLMHFDGTNGSTTFVDEKGAACSGQGGITISTAQSRFGSASGLFDGVDDRVQVANSSRLNFAGDFSVACSLYPTELGVVDRGIFFIGTSGSNNGRIQSTYNASGVINFFIADAAGAAVMNIQGTSDLVLNAWNHIECVVSGSTGYVFVNGALKATGAVANGYRPSGAPLYVGYARGGGLDRWAKGHVDELLVTNTALHTSAFAPRETPYTLGVDQTAAATTQTATLVQVTAPASITASQTAQATSNSPNLPTWLAALAAIKAGSAYGTIACVGDSTTAGVGAGNTDSGYGGGYARAYPSKLAAALTAAGVPSSFNSFFGHSNVDYATHPAWNSALTFGTGWTRSATVLTLGGPCIYFTGGSAGALTYTPPEAFDTFDVYYLKFGSNGSFTTKVDGGASLGTTTTSTANADGEFSKATFSTSLGLHTISFDPLLNGDVYIVGVDAYVAGVKKAHVWNLGFSAAKAAEFAPGGTFAWRQHLAIGTLNPDLTVFCCTINDWVANTSIATYKSQMQTFITAAKAVGDVVLMTGAPSNTAAASTNQQATFVQALSELASTNGVPFVNLVERFGSWAASSSLYNDNLHPNESGGVQVADAVGDAILPSMLAAIASIGAAQTAQATTQGATLARPAQAVTATQNAAATVQTATVASVASIPGGDPYNGNVALRLEFDSDFSDSSPRPKTVSVIGSPTITVDGYTASSANVGLSVGNSSDFQMGAGAFTIEAFIKPTAAASLQIIAALRTNAGGSNNSMPLLIESNKVRAFLRNAAGTLVADTGDVGTIANGVEHHIAWVRDGSGNVYLFVNGVSVAGAISFASAIGNTTSVDLFTDTVVASRDFNGSSRGVRITQGVARWTANFTPPTSFDAAGAQYAQTAEPTTQTATLEAVAPGSASVTASQTAEATTQTSALVSRGAVAASQTADATTQSATIELGAGPAGIAANQTTAPTTQGATLAARAAIAASQTAEATSQTATIARPGALGLSANQTAAPTTQSSTLARIAVVQTIQQAEATAQAATLAVASVISAAQNAAATTMLATLARPATGLVANQTAAPTTQTAALAAFFGVRADQLAEATSQSATLKALASLVANQLAALTTQSVFIAKNYDFERTDRTLDWPDMGRLLVVPADDEEAVREYRVLKLLDPFDRLLVLHDALDRLLIVPDGD